METVGVWSATILSDFASSNRAKASQRDIVKRVLERSLKYLYSREIQTKLFLLLLHERRGREREREREKASRLYDSTVNDPTSSDRCLFFYIIVVN